MYTGRSSITAGTLNNKNEHEYYVNKICSVLSRCITKQNIKNLEESCSLYNHDMQDLFVKIYANIIRDTVGYNSIKYQNIHCSFKAEPVQFGIDNMFPVSIINHDTISKIYMNSNKAIVTKESINFKVKDDIVFNLEKNTTYTNQNIYRYIKLSKTLAEKVIRLYVIADHAAQHFVYLVTNADNINCPNKKSNQKHVDFDQNQNFLPYIFSSSPNEKKHKLLHKSLNKNLFHEFKSNHYNNDKRVALVSPDNALTLLDEDEYDYDTDDENYEDIEDDTLD